MIPTPSTTSKAAAPPRNAAYISPSSATGQHSSSSSSSSTVNPPPTVEPTSTSTSSSIRPRNRRLLSTEQELVSTTSATSTPTGSRAASPIPRKHPSRSVRGRQGNGMPVGGLLAPDREREGERTGRGRSSPSPVGVGIGSGTVGGGGWYGGWTSSWSALQGLASSVLGGDILGDGRDNGGVTNGPTMRQKRLRSSGDSPAAWGPEGLPKVKEQRIGAGSTTEREAKLKTRQTASVLEGREANASQMLDANGNYKRRTSLEEARHDPLNDTSDALVYIHHVQPQDTLAGVVLKYNCQPAVFRKANRFWPNDSIQTRKMVVLPVDACTIKGRPCEAPTADRPGVDLLAPTPGIEDPPPFQNGVSWPTAPTSSQPETSAERTEGEEEPTWSHVRWVLLDSSPNSRPVEIARMTRKTLGYFPPRRRKSQNTASTVSTPRGSIDFPQISRSPSQDPSGSPRTTSSRRTSNLSSRPLQSTADSYFPALPSHSSSSSRLRRESVGEAANRMGWMRRPGGVGTLGKNVRMPGPANDGLNTWAKKHIPGLAIDEMPSTSISAGESARLGFGAGSGPVTEGFVGGSGTGMLTASGSTHASSGGLGLENAAAAIEGWVRRLAIKPGTPKLGGRHTMAGVDGTVLIELLDGTGSDDGRGFELNSGSSRSGTPIGSSGGATGREDSDVLVRGRSAPGAKSGKSD